MTKESNLKESVDVSQITFENSRDYVVTDKQFDKLVEKLETTAETFKTVAQDTAIQALISAFAHDNYDRMTRVYKATQHKMSDAAAKQMKEFFESYSDARLVTTKAGKSFRKNTKEGANKFDLNGAVQNPWYTIGMQTDKEVAEKIAKIFASADLENSLRNLVKRANKAIKEGNVERKDVPNIRAKLRVIENALEPVLSQQEPQKETEKKAA